MKHNADFTQLGSWIFGRRTTSWLPGVVALASSHNPRDDRNPRMTTLNQSKASGFTLIELLVVISIIALLSSLVAVAIKDAKVKARDVRRIANARGIITALEMHAADGGGYYLSNTGRVGPGNDSNGFVAKVAGDTDADGVTYRTTSIIGSLKDKGLHSGGNLTDPVFGKNNYYLATCAASSTYGVYLKVEQPSLAVSSTTLLAQCGGATAVGLGMNYLVSAGGVGVTAGVAGAIGESNISYTGSVGLWNTTTPYPSAIQGHGVVVANGRMYVTGGDGSTQGTTTVRFAQINGNGTIGSWQTTTPLPGPRYMHGAVFHNGFIYVLGGLNGGTELSAVVYAPVNPDGTLGVWVATTAFPTARRNQGVVVWNSKVYATGGNVSNTASSSVIYATINGDGTVGSWSAAVSLPVARYDHQTVVSGGQIYVLGGVISAASSADVRSAPVLGDGSLGAWSVESPMLTPRYMHSAVAVNGYIYTLGGFNSPTSTSTVARSLIDGNGSLGAWATTTPMLGMRQAHRSVTHNGYVYVVSGYATSSLVSEVSYAPLE